VWGRAPASGGLGRLEGVSNDPTAPPLSTAELSAYLSLPFSVVTVLLTDLLAKELVQARAPIVRQKVADRNLLEAVMHGLQKL
ncbi:DUF742 domain-containing protein, partial [Streptomyces ardesiacus]|uniref:DUF742 domain-containing protein n=1 Tax=Streptomyces ardesiacus TaxID=285564 RepID=UPI003669316D